MSSVCHIAGDLESFGKYIFQQEPGIQRVSTQLLKSHLIVAVSAL